MRKSVRRIDELDMEMVNMIEKLLKITPIEIQIRI